MNKMKKYNVGQVNVEYMLLMMFVVFFFFVGVDGNPPVIDFFINTIKEAFEKFSGFISIPI